MERIREGAKDFSDIIFRDKPDETDDYAYLSPYYPTKMIVEMTEFSSYAQYFYYCFYKPWASNYAEAIKGASTQGEIYNYVRRGPSLPNKYTGIWNQSKLQIAWKGVEAKFGQNPELQKKLLQTGSRRLFYDCGDVYWGRKGKRGLNYLGKLIMKHREDVQGKIMGDSDEEEEEKNAEFFPIGEELNGVDDDPDQVVMDVSEEFRGLLIEACEK